MSFEQSELDINYLSLVVALSNFTYKVRTACLIGSIARQMGHCMGVNFNIHIWAWSASPSVQVGGL